MNRNPSMAGLASLVQSRGRGGDSVLVHMTPGEVKGLQALALAHGGQLSINPETGLYEANFLKKLLPTIIGAVLTPLTGGLINPMTAGLLVGGVEAVRTGDIGRGLMAGLGAYGGAGLGSALSGVGAAATDASTKMLAQEAAQGLGKEAGAKAAQEAVTSQIKTMAGTPSFSNIGAGIKEIATGGQNLGLGGFGAVKALGSTMGMPAISGLGMTAANAMSPDMQIPGGGYEIDDSYYESGGYDPVTGTFREGRFRKGYPGFPPPGMAEGGVIPAPNGNYPLARPSNSVGGYGPDIDPYTGEERFADGGSVGNQDLQQYYQSLLSAPAPQAAPNQAFANYMQGLNQFVTSPVAPPAPPKQQPPAAGIAPPGAGGRPIAGGGRPPVSQPPNARFPYRGRYGGDEGDAFLNTGDMYGGGGDGAMRWDSGQGRFVSDAPQMSYDAASAISGNPFSGFSGIDFSALQNLYGARNTGGMRWDADSGQFTADQPMLNQYDQFTADVGQGMDQGQMPDYGNMDFSGIDFSGLQNINMSGMGGSGSYMPDMSAMSPEYAGGTPNYDMGNQPIQEFLGTPYMPEMAYGPPTDVTNQYPGVYGPTTTFSDLTAAETYDPTAGRQPFERPVFPSDDQMQYALPSPDFSGVDSGLIPQAPPESMQPGLSGYVPPPDMGGLSFAAFKPPQSSMPPAPDMGGLGSLGGIPQMQQAAPQPMPQPMPQFSPQPAFDMSGFGGGFDGSEMGMFAAGGPIQYAAGGKFLRGPGDGMSDDIKANINGEQEARLADGEFVIPADVVSHIGNGSSEAGADRLHVMMDRIRKARTGRTRQAPEIDSDKYLPA